MKKCCLLLLIGMVFVQAMSYGSEREVLLLNGTWQFDQTTTAFPPKKFTRTIPVPGLVHLAIPRITQYDKFFQKPTDVETVEEYNFLEQMDYTPMYNWYRREVAVPAEAAGKEAFITIRKSQYVTQVFVNGIDMGSSMECYTPIEFPITHALKPGQKNEILIKVGDRAWLPAEAAGGTDKEKVRYMPGIWDDVEISFTGKQRLHKVLMLPSVKEQNVTAKVLVRNLHYAQMTYGAPMQDSCRVEVEIFEKVSGKRVITSELNALSKRDNQTEFALTIPMKEAKLWSPDDPFLYSAKLSIYDAEGKVSDTREVNFGMRDFGKQGKHFTLNGEKIYLRGSNITLQRFFEDPDCADLVWDKAWVRKLMGDLPKEAHWNAMRICVGIVPNFWYDIADEYGLMLQNEWLYWQNHGWDDQIRAEYTDWVWSDGSHPSIVIWDAINENVDEYIGNSLIPELKKLDPTRIWDSGYMTADQMKSDEMDEPHPYRALTLMHSSELNDYFQQNPYNMGDFDEWSHFQQYVDASSPQLINEYGWCWLWRDGRPSKLTVNNYNYYTGEQATAQERRELQAYWLQLETEWLRSERSMAGVLAFTHLTNNYGFTGDWFIDQIKDLTPAPVFHWFKHCFAPTGVFINLTDQRYTKHLTPYTPGSPLVFNLVGINDLKQIAKGVTTLILYNDKGEKVYNTKIETSIPAYGKNNRPYLLNLPTQGGGYTLVAEFLQEGTQTPVLSRRYIKVGTPDTAYSFYEIQP